MSKDLMRYDVIVEEALRSVVKRALVQVAETGLPGDHHFYITFRTSFPGVQIPEYLAERYPEEMTIVLQFQFYGLEIRDDAFSVSLNFNNIPEHLVLPYEAITIFADPSVNFALQFKVDDEDGEEDEDTLVKTKAEKKKKDEKKEAEKSGEVVSLDHFRRNK